jgi:hypothetical protein
MARLAGIGISLFLALFALDAFDGRPLAETLPAFAIHLWPAALCAVVVALGWRRWWAGAVGFAALAAAYAVGINGLGPGGRLDWIVAISGPLAVTAMLFLLAGPIRPGRA